MNNRIDAPLANLLAVALLMLALGACFGLALATR